MSQQFFTSQNSMTLMHQCIYLISNMWPNLHMRYNTLPPTPWHNIHYYLQFLSCIIKLVLRFCFCFFHNIYNLALMPQFVSGVSCPCWVLQSEEQINTTWIRNNRDINGGYVQIKLNIIMNIIAYYVCSSIAWDPAYKNITNMILI